MNVHNSNMKLTKSPIIETTLDIVCSFKIPTDAVLGVLYAPLNKTFGILGVQALPILNLPEALRESDSNLRNKPTHKIDCGKGIVAVGPHIVSISFLPPYRSWEEYMAFINEIIKIIEDLNIVDTFHLVNLRYLNFFKSNIYENINLNINLGGQKITYPSTIFKAEIPSRDNRAKVLQITNSVHVKNQMLGLDDDGSLIDIVVVSKQTSLENLIECVKESHQDAKDLFFSLLNEDLIHSLS